MESALKKRKIDQKEKALSKSSMMYEGFRKNSGPSLTSKTKIRFGTSSPSTIPFNNTAAPQPSPRSISSPAAVMDKGTTSLCSSAVPMIPAATINLTVQQAKKHAVAQAQQDGCTGNFRSFDSQFGNFLLPVIPTLADLTR